MDYKKLKETLKGLIKENTTQEDTELIANIVNQIDEAEKESNELLEKHEDLRQKYINAVRNSVCGGNPKEKEDDTPKTLEECIENVINERKEK